ncbi:MAG TPA: DNA primase [Bacteroidales bacterium]|nr:DNA primase [Bacteroidales bacterium]
MIPQQTVRTILETARIEEVVSDFVRLKRRGSNLIGLCPFHNEKTPSFTVSPTKGLFKCFGCGKGGDVASFVMEHEHMSYPEALKYLARRYHIEVEEREATPDEILQQNLRERLLNLNTFAQHFFVQQLFETAEGQSVGLSYFKERGFREATIRKFGLGYSPRQRDALVRHSREHGYPADVLLQTGLAAGSEERLFDRFHDRVIFPIHSLTGQVIGFGGRILDSDKSKAKYINSPESDIYSKSKTLYGIFFARQAMARLDSCLLVEGYTDVISMHQAGIENVVASSGTSLTIEQIRLIKRYTKNITILYDGDPAGIKASMRGVDMILEEGLNVRVLLFPEGDDPDSFVRKHPISTVEAFIRDKATDFITFKTRLLLDETGRDPIRRAALVTDIVETIALIPDPIYRSVYIKECSRMLEVEEQVLVNALNKLLRKKFGKKIQKPQPDEAAATPAPPPQAPEEQYPPGYYQERELIKIMLQYGNNELNLEMTDDQGQQVIYRETVAQFILSDLEADKLGFEDPLHRTMLDIFSKSASEGIIPTAQQFLQSADANLAKLTVDLITSPYELHNWERKKIFVKTETDVLKQAITTSLYRYKDAILRSRSDELTDKLREATDVDEQTMLQMEKMEIDRMRKIINQQLGIVITR